MKMKLPKIIVADDEARFCESLSYLLKTKGYKVTTAFNGQELLNIARENPFDLVILDVHLPDMMGTELLGRINSLSPGVSVVIISGEADVNSALAALKHGAYDYLRKPFEFEELLKTVENALNQKALEQEKVEIDRKLNLSEEKYRYLVQNSPDIIYTLDKNGNFTFLSDALEHLLRVTVADLIGKHYSTIVWDTDQQKAKWLFNERRSKERSSSGTELRLKKISKPRQDNRENSYLTFELTSMGIFKESTSGPKKLRMGTYGILRDISARKQAEKEREKLISELRDALENVKVLQGLLPICTHCKKIRDDGGYWTQIESYISNHSKAAFSHSICPECAKIIYPDYELYD